MSGFVNNIQPYIFFGTITAISLIITADWYYAILPLYGSFLILYLILVLSFTIWAAFIAIEKLLKTEKPFIYETFTRYTPKCIINKVQSYLRYRGDVPVKPEQDLEGFNKKLKEFFVSMEDLLNENCKEYVLDGCMVSETMVELENLITKFLKVLDYINFQEIVHCGLVIVLKHIKEFKRCVKRTNTYGGNIEDNFRFQHMASQNGQVFENFIMKVTNEVIYHFLNPELYNSLSGQCLTGMLAKKVTMAKIIDFSKPGFLNYQFINLFACDKTKTELRLDYYGFISICDVDLTNDKYFDECDNEKHPKIIEVQESKVEDYLLESDYNSFGNDVVDFIDGKCNAGVKEETIIKKASEDKRTELLENTTETTGDENNRLISEPVKIYQSKSTNKTWRYSSDLDCISLGEEILEFDENKVEIPQNSTVVENAGWKDNLDCERKVKKTDSFPKTEEEHSIFGTACDKVFTSSSSIQTGAATLVSNTVKQLSTTSKEISNATANTIHNMKELQQSTVNNVIKPVSQATTNAMHKIEDLQDEAAGMVEGLLDFGKAGFRKGLRLTGLQDNHNGGGGNIEGGNSVNRIPMRDVVKSKVVTVAKGNTRNSSSSSSSGHASGKLSKLDSNSSGDSGSVWINPLMSNSPSFDGEILLEKSPTDSGITVHDLPSVEINPIIIDSPDAIEYEDTPDLATTTAKLRSLLAQRTESALSTPALSPMPTDDKSSLLQTPLDPSTGSFDELSDVDGALPSMYKQWAKTATGVFQNTLNTIKTALPGNPDFTHTKIESTKTPLNEWSFEPNNDRKLYKRISKLISERKEFCTIDNAYEAVENYSDQVDSHRKTSFDDDELDSFDHCIPTAKILVDILSELAGDIYPVLGKAPFVKVILLLFGDLLEKRVRMDCAKIPQLIREAIKPFKEDELALRQMALVMTINDIVETIINDSLTGFMKHFLGEESLQAVFKLFLESLQSQRINEDMALQMVELVAAKTIDGVRNASLSEK